KEVDGNVKRVPVKERYPVLTIVLYFGERLWEYPKNLKECFYPPLAEDEITDAIKEYIQDYRIHVFDIPRLTKEQVQMFQPGSIRPPDRKHEKRLRTDFRNGSL
ncbi:MAG: Rpn family recombination-promoting nuclease/putative transposase, partial [Firmicutes bacterium]|nr:Rpn family recombination-promoting nuclease/putative transposase [Bacillota bacterium]